MVSLITSETPFDMPKTLRVLFRKAGRLRYISHLDLVRTMTRVLIRAHIPVAYSEGFNPIPRLSFAAPLSVGVESNCEIMDIKITHPVDCGRILEALNENLCPELSAFEAYMSETKPNLITSVTYDVKIYADSFSANAAEEVAAVLNAKPLTVVKATKAGDKETDISPIIRSAEVAKEKDALSVKLVLNVDNASFLNPEYIMKALLDRYPLFTGDLAHEYYTVLRTGFYVADGSLFR